MAFHSGEDIPTAMPGELMPVRDPGTRRVFFALPVSAEVRDTINATVERMKKGAVFTGARPKWVEPDQYHVTLWFLGNVDGAVAKRLIGGMTKAMRGIPSFQMDVRTLNYFPSPRIPSVLYIGVKNIPKAMVQARERAASLISEAGLTLPEQDFHPHITLARLKGSPGLPAFVRMAETYHHTKAGKCDVTEVHLMESIPKPDGAVYQTIATAALDPMPVPQTEAPTEDTTAEQM